MVAEISLFLLFNLEQYRIKTKLQPFKGWQYNTLKAKLRPLNEGARETFALCVLGIPLNSFIIYTARSG